MSDTETSVASAANAAATQSPQGEASGPVTEPVSKASPPASKAALPGLANGAGHVEPQTAWAVLLRDVGERTRGHVVFGAPDAIAAAIAAGDARAAQQHDIDVSNPFHYPLPASAAAQPEA